MTYGRVAVYRYGLIALLLAVVPAAVQAQERASDEPRTSPNATVTQTIGTEQIKITYGRPHVRGRQIFGDLVPRDSVWRTGANEATTITFPTDVQIEGESLDAGTYSLFTIPGRDQWTIIFNNVAQQWGAFDYEQAEDALRVNVEPQDSPATEMVTFTFENVTDTSAEVVIEWANVRVPFTVELASSSRN